MAGHSSHQPHTCGNDIASSPSEEENADLESQLDMKPSRIHKLLKVYGNLLALLAIIVIHVIFTFSGGSNTGNNLTLSFGACGDGVNASHIGDAVNCLRLNQTSGS
jgi:hypothetical protein